MSRPISRPARRAGGARLVAAESLALAALLLIAVYVLRDTDLVAAQPWQPAAALGAGLAAHWTLQALVGGRVAFWLMAPLLTLPHVAAAWSHNRIAWHELLELQEALVADRSFSRDLALLVACLGGLMILHRIIGIRRLNRQVLIQQVEPQERRRLVRNESLVVAGLVAAGLLATGATILMAGALARNDGLLGGPPPAVAAIGAGAAVLLASTLWLWFRGPHRTAAPHEPAAHEPAADLPPPQRLQ